jgi:hypothetical protein
LTWLYNNTQYILINKLNLGLMYFLINVPILPSRASPKSSRDVINTLPSGFFSINCALGEVTVDEMNQHIADGQFAKGSMLPKVEAALQNLLLLR